jgi:ubiquitin-protein ligase
MCLWNKSSKKVLDCNPGPQSPIPAVANPTDLKKQLFLYETLLSGGARIHKRLLHEWTSLKSLTTLVEKHEFDPEGSIFEWLITIRGPKNTPFAGVPYTLLFTFPEKYPFEPPEVRFKTRIFHPNISAEDGKVCLNILKSGDWSPALSIELVLLSIQAIMCDPNPEDPLNLEAAKKMLRRH